MEIEQEDNICALCKWNNSVENNFFCGNLNQDNIRLKHGTNYNDGCGLFEEREDRKIMYDFSDREFNK